MNCNIFTLGVGGEDLKCRVYKVIESTPKIEVINQGGEDNECMLEWIGILTPDMIVGVSNIPCNGTSNMTIDIEKIEDDENKKYLRPFKKKVFHGMQKFFISSISP